MCVQVAVIYGGVNGYLDKLAVSEVPAFEAFFRKYLKEKHAIVLETIRKERKMTPETLTTLKQVYDGALSAWAAAK